MNVTGRKLISVVTPCYNEELNILDCYEAVRKLFAERLPEYDYEHIFCDNASRDSSPQILADLAARDERGLAGDFVLSATYALEPWVAGTREACLGLYAVAPDGTFRIYAQRVSRADDPDYVVADVDGRCGTTRATPRQRVGELRIASERGSIFAWHREDTSWTWLARARAPLAKSLIVGIKVWASGFSGPLTARITGFRLEGKPDANPTPPPPVRPDPRQASHPASHPAS